jgi:hypothetical protein
MFKCEAGGEEEKKTAFGGTTPVVQCSVFILYVGILYGVQYK